MRFTAEEAHKYSFGWYSSKLESAVYREIERIAKVEHFNSYEFDLTEQKPYGKTLEEFDKQFQINVALRLEQDGYSVDRREETSHGSTYPHVVYTISW